MTLATMTMSLMKVRSTSNHMFKKEIWDKFPELNEGNFKIEINEGGKFPPNFTNKHGILG